ncbi:PKD domain-containing protein [Spirosoma taeanense]|uniref:PKD domain-containing protein n=1 Tax=Spirosoma taeanense TaxID=2735870 RepID=A0A6M5YBX7_9BACT|nr:PKD domain-containing protein [Spirosoma taeanense]QJW91628.1 PKD domain-containing protein [Spirosoma taeanense]
MNSKLTLSARTFLLATVALLGLYAYTDEPKIQASIYPLQQVVGQPIRYVDSTMQAEDWHWEFGNGQEARREKGLFTYFKPGTYLIRLTVNESTSKTFTVVIKPKPVSNSENAIVRIQGPKSGFEEEKLVFTAVGGQAKQFTWRFGASGQVDSREQTAIYSYPREENYGRPRRYTVELMTDVTKYPIQQQVTIYRGYNKFDPPIDSLDLISGDIRQRLQFIADGRPFNNNYNYLLQKYLCNHNNTLVRTNGTKANDFYSYCMGLQFDRGVRIDAVSIASDTLTSCVVRLDVTQHK